jgi:hypothetical protein
VDSFILLPKICGVGGLLLLRALSSTGGLVFLLFGLELEASSIPGSILMRHGVSSRQLIQYSQE